jgi:hypothetical protein
MPIFDQLKKNKGTVSSALGKELACKVLNGNADILSEAIQLVHYDVKNEKSKNIRAGAAKIIEKVAEKKPEIVSPYLKSLFPALTVIEPQTRWMLMMAFGYCARLEPELTSKGIIYAKQYIHEQQGVCLSGAAETFLGCIGATSNERAEIVLPILLDAIENSIPNEVDWVLEAFYSILDKLSMKSRTIVAECSKKHGDSSKSSTKKRVSKILKKIDSLGYKKEKIEEK